MKTQFKIALIVMFVAFGVISASLSAQDFSTMNIVRSIAFNPDGQRVAIATQFGEVRVIDADTREVLQTLSRSLVTEDAKLIYTMAWNPRGTLLAAAGVDRQIIVWDASKDYSVQYLRPISGGIESLAWSSKGTYLATASQSMPTITIWDVTAGQMIFSPSVGDASEVVWHPDSNRFAVSRLQEIQIWDLMTQQKVETIPIHYWATALDWSPDGTRMVNADFLGSIEPPNSALNIWDVNAGQLLMTLTEHEGVITSAQWSPDGTRLVTSSHDKTVKVWDAASGEVLATYQSDESVFDAAFSPYGARIVFAKALLPETEQRDVRTKVDALEVVVPAPSLEQLNAIQKQCLPSERSFTMVRHIDELPQWITQLENTSDIEPGCASDLLAVAHALTDK